MALRELIAQFGIEVDDKQLRHADSKVEEFVGKLQTLGRVLVGGAAAVGFFEFAKGLSETGDQLDKASIRLGMGTDALQEFGFAAGQSGAGIENFTMGLLMLEDKVGDAMVNASGEGAKAFKKYGIDIHAAGGRVKDATELFEEAADKIADTKDAAKQVTIAMDLFGKQGRTLLPLLKEGKDGIAELRDEFRKLGGGFSKEAVKASRDFDDALGRLGVVVQSVKGKIAQFLLPVLQRGVDWLTKTGASLFQMAKNSNLLQVALGALGGVLAFFAVRAALAFAPVILGAAAVAALVIAIDDFVTMLQGGESLLGDFIDRLFGKDAHVEVVNKIKDLWTGIKDVMGELGRELKVVWDLYKKILDLGSRAGGAVGDAAGRVRNAVVEATTDTSKGRGGLSYSQKVAFENAQKVLEAQVTGGTPNLEIPKGEGDRASYMGGLQPYINAIQSGQYPQFQPRAVGPAQATVNQQNVIHVHGVTDPEAVGKAVDERLSQHADQAADTLHKTSETK
jgi:hypothetical protein